MGDEQGDNTFDTGRVKRGRRLGMFGAGMGSRLALTQLRGAGRSTDRKIELYEGFHRQTAEQMRLVLGQMKGAATKLGQLASFIDLGTQVPPEFQPIYQEVLAELRDSTPPMSMDQVRSQFELDHGGPPEAVFATFDDEPLAAASIGQVHSATLFDGTPVVVKVQYPGIDEAIRADVRNLKSFIWLAPMIAPGLEPGPLVVELERALSDELDYVAEAEHQLRFAELYRDHPFIVVPEPVMELCGRHTLVAEMITGTGFDDFIAASTQDERDRIAEIIFRFAYGTLYRSGFFNADTHPGNYAILPDGRVVFYDFGAVKVIPHDTWRRDVRLARGLMEADVEGLFRDCVESGFIVRADKVDPQRFFDWLDMSIGRLVRTDRVLTLTGDLVGDVVASTTDPRNDWFSVTRWLNIEPDALMIARMQIGVMAVLARLEATANWHRIAREWIYDDPPSTPLGELDAEFFLRKAS